ncbi:MAG: ABC transporter permease [Chloroflexi bacterium]|nr:ABC transporter permease [Chloroflexota bacterium]
MIRASAGGRRHLDITGVPFAVLGLALFLFLAAPLILLEQNLSGADIATTLRDPQTAAAVVTSLGTASVSTGIIAILGVPLGYILARYRFPGKTLITVFVFLPLVLPPVSAGILLLILYGPYGTIGQLLSPHGFTFVDSSSGIVIAQVFVSAPFGIVAARSAFESVDVEYEEAAAAMGATVWQSFWHVALPMARGGIIAGLVLSWMRALGEFGATVILAYHPYSLPVLNYVNLSSTGLTEALPLALIALVLSGAVLLALFLLERVDWGARLTQPR